MTYFEIEYPFKLDGKVLKAVVTKVQQSEYEIKMVYDKKTLDSKKITALSFKEAEPIIKNLMYDFFHDRLYFYVQNITQT